MFILKGSYGYGKLKNIIALSVQFNILAITGLQSSQFHSVSYRADEENLGIFGATYPHGTVFALRQCLYQKESHWYGELKTVIAFSVQYTYYTYLPIRACQLHGFMQRRIGPMMKIWEYSVLSIPMVPCLH